MRTKMTFIEIVRTLYRHRMLADKRSYGSEQNKTAKVMVYVSSSLCIIYLIGLAIPFAMIANESRTTTAAELFADIFPFILLLDFGMRFLIQQTPAQIVRPYTLLPLPRYACVDTFILSSILSLGNLVWLAFILPYLLMAVVFSYGLLTTSMIVIFSLLLIAANSQWYTVVRTLVNESVLWWLLPVAVYGLLATPFYIGADAGFDQFDAVYSTVGTAIDRHNPMAILVPMLLLAALVCINRKLQYKYVQIELMRENRNKEVKTVNSFKFLERYGELGTFIQLEIKLLMRNKTPRKAFLTGIYTMLFISLIIIFSDVYDSNTMTNFWGLYNFILLGSQALLRTMGYEGNYIDCLLVRKENILELLRAKYIFYSALLIIPFVLMLPVVISGKWSLYMLVSYAVFTIGFQYFLLLQTAVYNMQTIPLNEKLTTKGGLDGNYLVIGIMISVFLIPNILVGAIQSVFSNNVAYSIMLVIGIVFVITHPIWLRNIYNRMMKRKYKNLESFTASRS